MLVTILSIKSSVEKCFLGMYLCGISNVSGGSSMKSSHHFRDQLSVMTGWFEQWNNCEQSVALYSLIKKIEPGQARFLVQVLEQNIAHCVQLQLQEQQANDPGELLTSY
ncbi:protein Smaug 1 [Caerostris extrusa]|uniref:Protein Smaug 1 n=1 Tax=Caerostris extrusa TaxID=172846 RepID=A0AAV4MJ66_CAEEX|nr:protein Smaug 1 [Caerostris extrusa]